VSSSSFPSEGLRVLVVDDEELACRNLRRKLLELGDMGSVDVMTDPAEAVVRLRESPPDVVFLDVRMPGLSGFEVLAHFPERERPFAAIFCTAYDEHATAAFEAAALDYLLKPVEPTRLAAAVSRARRFLSGAARDELERARTQGLVGWLERVVARYRGGLEVVPLDEVVAISSEAHQAVAYTRDAEHVLESSLSALEPQLDPARFVRTHRAHLVQVKYVVAVHGDEVRLAGGRAVPLSRRARKAVLERVAKALPAK